MHNATGDAMLFECVDGQLVARTPSDHARRRRARQETIALPRRELRSLPPRRFTLRLEGGEEVELPAYDGPSPRPRHSRGTVGHTLIATGDGLLTVPVRRVDDEWLDPPLPEPIDGVIFIAEAAVTRIPHGRLGRTDVFCPAGYIGETTRGTDHRVYSALGID